eukprot:11308127-Heterocapsa_arctica.AAC.1
MHHINTEIHSFGNDIHIRDGDELIPDEECVNLLYCNFIKRGEQPNHYDFLHNNQQIPKPGKIFVTKEGDNLDPIDR